MKRDTDLPEPLYNVLIKRALSNKEVDTRMAVVEAISSLEISFAAALKKHFSSLFKCRSKKKTDKFNALLEYIFYKPSFEDYKQLSKFMLKNKIDKKELTNLDNALKIRNEVVHNGKIPSVKEVEDVLAVACSLSLQLFLSSGLLGGNKPRVSVRL